MSTIPFRLSPFFLAVIVSFIPVISSSRYVDIIGSVVAAILIGIGVLEIIRYLSHIEAHLRNITKASVAVAPIPQRKSHKNNQRVNSFTIGINNLLIQISKRNVSIKNFWRKDYELGQDILNSSNSILDGVQSISTSTELLEKTTGKFDNKIIESKLSIDSIQNSLNSAQSIFQNQISAVEESSAAVEELLSSINNIAGISKAKHETLNQLIEVTEQGRAETRTAVEAFSSISSMTTVIMNMVDLICDIAERTNLLSMNAAIEAAHAGDKGRGFAVVATEVKKLANSSKKNAASISTTLNDIIRDVDRTVNSSSILQNSMNEILIQVKETASSFEEIISGLTEMSAGTNQISTSLATLVETSAESKRQTDRVLSESLSLQENLGEVEEHSKINLSNVHAISAEIRKISSSLQLLFDVCDDNSQNLTHMRTALEKTRTAKRFVGDYIPPFQFIDKQKPAGAFLETINLISNELGEKDQIEFMPFNEAYELTLNTPEVFMMTVLRTPQREDLFRWIGPIVPDTHYLYRLSDRNDIAINTENDLKNYNLGNVKNNYSYKYFTDRGVPENKIHTVDTQSMNIQNLFFGIVDLIPMSVLQSNHQLKLMKRKSGTVVPAYTISGFPTDAYLAVSLSTPENIYKKYYDVFENIRRSSSYKAVLAKYS